MTSFTAHILSNAVNRHPHLISFTDIIVHALGPKAKVLVNALVLLELTGAKWVFLHARLCSLIKHVRHSVALLVLSSDNLSALFPTYSPTFFKLCSLSTYDPLSI